MTKRNTAIFDKIRQNFPKCLISTLSFQELTSQKEPDLTQFKDDTPQVWKILRESIDPDLENICFMDMRAEKTLKAEDAKQFKFLVFGGILGDHPPQDRAQEFREIFKHIRQLGPTQMTTDTALLVSHEILEGRIELENLTFVEDPQVPMSDSVVRYLDVLMPISTISEKGFDLATT